MNIDFIIYSHLDSPYLLHNSSPSPSLLALCFSGVFLVLVLCWFCVDFLFVIRCVFACRGTVDGVTWLVGLCRYCVAYFIVLYSVALLL